MCKNNVCSWEAVEKGEANQTLNEFPLTDTYLMQTSCNRILYDCVLSIMIRKICSRTAVLAEQETIGHLSEVITQA